ncbi:hypothetical protein [Kingella oralis]|uniref:Uncharacterized protein n=1 Tax=Kingella oralis ATCC 51147 TaxID=629741 RepID=C4GJC6_9NEIS|nr:hypothetical protein [Kingella oralis]EEP67898.1 hypothetical protein GCWU000324_02149 [Kingella oralis ATCC 51147]QMT43295.1 hypothetical protein H3L93_02855 [Kingella oralis]
MKAKAAVQIANAGSHSLVKQRKVSAPLARDAWLKLHPTLTTKHQLIFRLPHLTHTKRQPETAPRTHL